MTKLSLLIIAIVTLGNSNIIFPKDTIINMDIEIAVLIILSVSLLSLENDFCNAKVTAEDDNANIGSATAPIMVSNKLYVAIFITLILDIKLVKIMVNIVPSTISCANKGIYNLIILLATSLSAFILIIFSLSALNFIKYTKIPPLKPITLPMAAPLTPNSGNPNLPYTKA